MKNTNILLTITFLLVTSCATINVVSDCEHYVDSSFKIYIDEFMKQAEKNDMDKDSLQDFAMIFASRLDGNTAGICLHPTNTILVNAEYWKLIDEYQREDLIFHELGHCVLGRSHCDAKNEDGTPVSIMNPRVMWSATYMISRDRYVKELFKPDHRCP